MWSDNDRINKLLNKLLDVLLTINLCPGRDLKFKQKKLSARSYQMDQEKVQVYINCAFVLIHRLINPVNQYYEFLGSLTATMEFIPAYVRLNINNLRNVRFKKEMIFSKRNNHTAIECGIDVLEIPAASRISPALLRPLFAPPSLEQINVTSYHVIIDSLHREQAIHGLRFNIFETIINRFSNLSKFTIKKIASRHTPHFLVEATYYFTFNK